jgi:membrane protein
VYTRVWELPNSKGIRALRGSLVWLVGWVVMLQTTALVVRSITGIPLTGAVRTTVQVLASTLLWWWTARLLLAGRVSWRRLLPGAALTAVLLTVLSRLSAVFMPPFTRANLEQYGPLGVVFSIGSWLVVFGGVLVVSAVLGRLVSTWQAGSSSNESSDEQAGGQPTGDGGSGRGTGDGRGGRDVGAALLRDPRTHLHVRRVGQEPAGHQGPRDDGEHPPEADEVGL